MSLLLTLRQKTAILLQINAPCFTEEEREKIRKEVIYYSYRKADRVKERMNQLVKERMNIKQVA